jgi:hypothetical protein
MNTLAYAGNTPVQISGGSEINTKFIDKRLVRKLHRIGTTPDGFALYSCKPVWSLRTRSVVLSQDVQKRDPLRVQTGLFGNLKVI